MASTASLEGREKGGGQRSEHVQWRGRQDDNESAYPCSCKALMACARLTCACSMTSLMSSSLTSAKEKQVCEMEVWRRMRMRQLLNQVNEKMMHDAAGGSFKGAQFVAILYIVCPH
jgi:hypothetical protein